MKTGLAVLAAIFWSSTAAYSKNIDSLWTHRAFIAKERIDSLEKAFKKYPRSASLDLKIKLEEAYARVIDQPEIARKISKTELKYHLMVQFDKETVFVMTYSYSPVTTEFLGASIFALPLKWVATFHPDAMKKDIILLQNIEKNISAIAISISDPFACFVGPDP